MKCDELKQVENPIEWGLYYDKAEVDEAIAELKNKLEDAKATAYAEMVDAGMRERRLRRALWIARVRALRDFLCQAIDQVDAMEEERRWRKCSEEMPPTDGSYMCAYKNKNKDDGVLFVDEAVWDGEKWSYKFDFWEDIIYWQFKPKAPEADK